MRTELTSCLELSLRDSFWCLSQTWSCMKVTRRQRKGHFVRLIKFCIHLTWFILKIYLCTFGAKSLYFVYFNWKACLSMVLLSYYLLYVTLSVKVENKRVRNYSSFALYKNKKTLWLREHFAVWFGMKKSEMQNFSRNPTNFLCCGTIRNSPNDDLWEMWLRLFFSFRSLMRNFASWPRLWGYVRRMILPLLIPSLFRVSAV